MKQILWSPWKLEIGSQIAPSPSLLKFNPELWLLHGLTRWKIYSKIGSKRKGGNSSPRLGGSVVHMTEVL